MDTRNLTRIDLNLLIALQVLLEEQNVGKAAERLFITQSAMSKTLSRLRILFKDDLFTRVGHGIVPTPRALELYSELEPLLMTADNIIADRRDDPINFSGKIVISTLDFFSLPLMPSLIATLCAEAPNLQLKVTNEIDEHTKEMANGNVDISINGLRTDYDGEDFFVEHLVTTQPVILMRADHPLKSLEIPSWDEINQYPEVALKVPSAQYIANSWLRSFLVQHINIKRIILETSDYLTALQTIASTDTIMFAPRISLTFVKQTNSITTMSIPAAEGGERHLDRVEVVMVYHKRTEKSPVHIWLRDQIKSVYSEQRAIFAKREAEIYD